MKEKKPHYSESDWWQYFCTMDAIESCTSREKRTPGRIKPNCLEMLSAKCAQIENFGLKQDALFALWRLRRIIEIRESGEDCEILEPSGQFALAV